VGTARTGACALERAFIDRPDVILVNLILLDMPGDMFITKLKQMPKTMDILLILYSSFGSSLNTSVVNQLSQKAGIHEVVGSEDPQTLLDKVRAILK
jgi:response regulator RpfG family c-di-GMP phosphodiesterase